MNDDKQQELFTEFKESEITKKAFGKVFFPEKTFTLSLSYEKSIILALITAIVLAVIFAAGFECGRQRPQVQKEIRHEQRRADLPAAPAQRTAAQLPLQERASTPPPAPRPSLPAAEKKTDVFNAKKPYTIQLATYRSKEYAQQEVLGLRGKGFPAMLIMRNNLYEIWVGEFVDQKAAGQMLKVLKKTYRDSSIKRK